MSVLTKQKIMTAAEEAGIEAHISGGSKAGLNRRPLPFYALYLPISVDVQRQ